jgi:hypothetical protein
VTADLRQFRTAVVEPALARLERLDGPTVRPEAVRLLLAIARQEGGPTLARRQVRGPARGVWQFERIGVQGVRTHPRTAALAGALIHSYGYKDEVAIVQAALEFSDGLAAGLARLLLWSDPGPLPVTQDGGWEAYCRGWRPGKPHPAAWSGCWQAAEEAMA